MNTYRLTNTRGCCIFTIAEVFQKIQSKQIILFKTKRNNALIILNQTVFFFNNYLCESLYSVSKQFKGAQFI